MSCQKAFGGYHIGRVVTAPLFQRVGKSHGNTKYTSKLKKGILRIDSLCAMVSFFLCFYLCINILKLTDRSRAANAWLGIWHMIAFYPSNNHAIPAAVLSAVL